jgi:aminoglycoside phosphotransferase (APT) family kinase protein
MFPVFNTIGLDLVRDQVNKNRFKQTLLAPLGRTVEQMWEDLWKAQAILDRGPQTLLHGDTHIGNCYLLPGEKGGLLDWQLMVRGCWAQDLTYLMVTGLGAAARRKHEREIIELYLAELGSHGVTEPPTQEQAWRNYRLSVIWGLVIGWLITPPQNYGRAITEANISRLVTAAQDLDSFGALEESSGTD